jgi:hypothetical protein
VNQPRHISGLAPGSRVEFRPEHVASIAVSGEEVGYDVEAFAAVSRRILEGAWPHFVYAIRRSSGNREARDSCWELWPTRTTTSTSPSPET